MVCHDMTKEQIGWQWPNDGGRDVEGRQWGIQPQARGDI